MINEYIIAIQTKYDKPKRRQMAPLGLSYSSVAASHLILFSLPAIGDTWQIKRKRQLLIAPEPLTEPFHSTYGKWISCIKVTSPKTIVVM